MEGESKLKWDEQKRFSVCFILVVCFCFCLCFSICWCNRSCKQTLFPELCLTTLMMAAHKLGGKQKAMLISSSIRTIGRKEKKKKINVCQIKVNIERERNFHFEILRKYFQHWRHSVSSLTFVNHRIIENETNKTLLLMSLLISYVRWWCTSCIFFFQEKETI